MQEVLGSALIVSTTGGNGKEAELGYDLVSNKNLTRPWSSECLVVWPCRVFLSDGGGGLDFISLN